MAGRAPELGGWARAVTPFITLSLAAQLIVTGSVSAQPAPTSEPADLEALQAEGWGYQSEDTYPGSIAGGLLALTAVARSGASADELLLATAAVWQALQDGFAVADLVARHAFVVLAFAGVQIAVLAFWAIDVAGTFVLADRAVSRRSTDLLLVADEGRAVVAHAFCRRPVAADLAVLVGGAAQRRAGIGGSARAPVAPRGGAADDVGVSASLAARTAALAAAPATVGASKEFGQ